MKDDNKDKKSNTFKVTFEKYKSWIMLGTLILVFIALVLFKFRFYVNGFQISKAIVKPIYIPLDENTKIYVYNDPDLIKTLKTNLTFNLNYTNLAKYKKVYFLVDPNLKGNFSLGIVQLEAEVLYPAEKYTGVEVIEGCLYYHPLCEKRKLFIGRCSNIFDGLCIEYVYGPLGIYQLGKNHIVISGNESTILLATDYFVLMYYGLV